MSDDRTLSPRTYMQIREENFNHHESWRDKSECTYEDAALFFRENSDISMRAAKAICRGCDVRLNCLVFAIDTAQPVGCWGGRTTKERHKLARRMRREGLPV